MRTYAFRLYPNREQRRRLDACLYESRQLYNDMLACQKQQYQETGTFLSRYDLNKRFKGRGGASVPATTLQLSLRSPHQSPSELSEAQAP
jgi:transposase